MTDTNKMFYSVTEVQRITGLSKHVIRNGIKSGKVPYIKSGNKYLINYPKYAEILNQESEDNITK